MREVDRAIANLTQRNASSSDINVLLRSKMVIWSREGIVRMLMQPDTMHGAIKEMREAIINDSKHLYFSPKEVSALLRTLPPMPKAILLLNPALKFSASTVLDSLVNDLRSKRISPPDLTYILKETISVSKELYKKRRWNVVKQRVRLLFDRFDEIMDAGLSNHPNSISEFLEMAHQYERILDTKSLARAIRSCPLTRYTIIEHIAYQLNRPTEELAQVPVDDLIKLLRSLDEMEIKDNTLAPLREAVQTALIDGAPASKESITWLAKHTQTDDLSLQ